MRSFGWVCSSVMVVGLLSSCAVERPRAPAPATQIQSRHVVESNYEVGVERSAFVGDAVVRVKDYYVDSTNAGLYRLRTTLTYRFHPFGPTKTFPAGTPAQWVGTVTVDGRDLRLIALPDGDARMYPLLVDDSGQYSGLVYGPGGSFPPGPNKLVELDPAMPQVESVTPRSVSTTQPFRNYEIVYSGTDDRSLNLLYREYTPTDLARPAFTQALTYARDAGTVRFRDIRIRVISADNEQIRYVVEADDNK